MEKKINIAAQLKYCPKGMELDCTMYDNVTFECILEGNRFPIQIQTPEGRMQLSRYGCMSLCTQAKCVIFPKGKTTWEGFKEPLKDGDVVSTDDGTWIGITTGGNPERFIPTYCVIKSNGEFEAYLGKKEKWQFDRLATEEEKQKLFEAIKANGYKWNTETKTLEKLTEPKFKVGDRIKHIVGREEIATVVGVGKLHYNLDSKVGTSSFSISLQREWELVPNKFDISTLKPFDKVLVRDNDNSMWTATFFSHLRGLTFYSVKSLYNQCIPFDGNEHLCGKTDDCADFFKTWE